MGADHSVLSIGNEHSSVDQVEAIAIQASITLGSCPKILHQTHSSTKGGSHCVSLICARQEYQCQQIAFYNKGKTQKKKVSVSSTCCGQINAVTTSSGSVKINSLKENSPGCVGCITS
eukprot:15345132-Ditylum_brightwellii.AAC.1